MTKIYWCVAHNQIDLDEPIQAFFRTESAAEAFVREHIAAGGSATAPDEVTLCVDKDRREIMQIEMEIVRRERKMGSGK